MLDQKDVRFDVTELGRLMRGRASATEISDALRSLQTSGIIEIDQDTNSLRRVTGQTVDEVPVALVRKLQAEMMYLGLESLFLDSPTDREIGSLTLSLTKEEFDELRFQLRKMRKSTQKDNAVRRQTSKGDRVYQLNLHLFPVTELATALEITN